MALSLACPNAEPYFLCQATRRRAELALAMGDLAKVLDRCQLAGADEEMVQAQVDHHWIKD
jgi:hypothetical protein